MAVFGRSFPIRGVTIHRGLNVIFGGSPQTLTPSLFSDADSFYSPTASYSNTLSPSLFSDADTFYAPTVVPGLVTLSPSLFSDTDSFYSPTASYSNTLAPSLFSDADSFYSPTFSETDTIAPSLVVDDDAFYVFTTTMYLAPTIYMDADTFYSATLGANVAPPLLSDADSFYAPRIDQQLAASLLVDTDSIYATNFSRDTQLLGATFIESDVFYPGTLTFTHFCTPGFVVDVDAFYAPSVVWSIGPSRLIDADSIYVPSLSSGTATILPPRYVDNDVFFSPFIANQKTTGGGGGGTGGNTIGNIKYASSLVMPEAGLITAVGATFSVSGAVGTAMAVYADNAGLPGALLGVSANQTFVVAGNNTYPLLVPVSVLLGQSVWIAVLTASNIAWVLQSSRSGARYNNNNFASGFSNPFGSSSVDNKKAPVFAVYLTAANATLSPSLFVDGDVFRGGTLSESNAIVVPVTYTDQDFFYQPVIGGLWTVLPNGYNDSVNDAIYVPTVAPQKSDVLPSLFVETDSVYAAFASIYDPLTPNLLVDTDAFYSPTIAQPFQMVAPGLLVDADAFYSPTLTGAFANLLPSRFVDADVVYSPVVAQGAADLFPALVLDADAVYAPTIALVDNVLPALVSDADAFYAPALAHADVTLAPALVADADAFYFDSQTGGYAASPTLFVDTETFYSPTVLPGTAFILPSLYADDRDQFWQWALTQPDGLQTLFPLLLLDADALYTSFIGKDQHLSPPLVPADDFFPPAGNVPLRHVYALIGNDQKIQIGSGAQVETVVELEGGSDGGDHVELLGEI